MSAAKALNRSIQLRSAPDASAYAGVGFFYALGVELDHEILVDCHDDPGIAMAALRAGCQKLTFSGDQETHRRLSDMAMQQGASIRHETIPSSPCLVLSPDDDGEEQARHWFTSA
ncbi:MAG: hypothetical protein ACRBM6_18275 [Geminicoccales bacterium]